VRAIKLSPKEALPRRLSRILLTNWGRLIVEHRPDESGDLKEFFYAR